MIGSTLLIGNLKLKFQCQNLKSKYLHQFKANLSQFILRRRLRDPHFFYNCCHFQYNISLLCFDSADVLKMTTILKEMRIVQLGS